MLAPLSQVVVHDIWLAIYLVPTTFFRKFRGEYMLLLLLLSYALELYPCWLRSNDDTRKLVGEVCALGIFQRGVMAGPDHQHWTLKPLYQKKCQPKTSTGHVKNTGREKNGPPWNQHCRKNSQPPTLARSRKNTYFVCWLASTNRQGTSAQYQ